jgi:two-component system, OmpR family, phosphate regulon response regulator PhoB
MNKLQFSALIIEDDRDIRDILNYQLQEMQFEVDLCASGEEAKEKIKHHQYQLYLVDWMLPGISGIELIKLIKQQDTKKERAIIMVTALSQPENVVTGLDAGADDYLSKPFDLNILKARIRAQLRRIEIKNAPAEEIIFQNLKVNLQKCQVTVDDEEIHLTATEFKILALLGSTPGHVFTREQLIAQILGEQVFVTNRTIDTHVAGLRKKIGSAETAIETIRGVGYRFKES